MQDLSALISMADKAATIAEQVEALKLELDVSLAPVTAAASNLSNTELRKLIDRLPDSFQKSSLRSMLNKRLSGVHFQQTYGQNA